MTPREERIWDAVFIAEVNRLFLYKAEEATGLASLRADGVVEAFRALKKPQPPFKDVF